MLAVTTIELLIAQRLSPPNTYDEGWYCLVANGWKQLFLALTTGHPSRFFEALPGLQFLHTTAKPLPTAINAFLLMLGGHAWFLVIPSALATAGTAIIVWQWAREAMPQQRMVAWAAAGVTVSSTFLATYGSMFYPHAIAGFFLTTALRCAWRDTGTPRDDALIGLLLSATVLSHYSLAPIVVPIVLYLLWRRRRHVRNLVILLLAFLSPFVLIATISAVIAYVVNAHMRPELVWSYVNEFRHQVVGPVNSAKPEYWYYLNRLWRVEGWPTALFLAAGLATLSRIRERWLAIVFFGALIFFSCLSTYAIRTLVPILPLGYLLGTLGAGMLIEKISGAFATQAWLALIGLILLVRLPYFVDLALYRNPLRAALAAVPAPSSANLYVSTSWPTASCILDRRVGASLELDRSVHGVFIDEGNSWNDESARSFLASARVIAEFPVARFAARDFWNEETIGDPVGTDRVIRIYRW